MKKEIALITGICGQDGSFLAKFLLNKGYKVFGTYRRNSSENTWRLEYLKILDKINLIDIDLLEYLRVFDLIKKIKPTEIYNLAAQSFVASSFTNPFYTTNVNSLAVLNLLESIKSIDSNIKFYQASTSEMFGDTKEKAQDEKTIFNPQSPYAISKVYSHFLVKNYSDSYDLKCHAGILFNHESELRGIEFVTKKITSNLSKYYFDNNHKTLIGNLYSKRDWGYADDYVDAMWRIIKHGNHFDYVIGTGKTHTIKQFIEMCLEFLNIKYEWVGQGLSERCINIKNKTIIFKVSKDFYRPSEVNYLRANPSRAKKDLGWKPKKDIHQIIEKMLKFDLDKNKP